MSVTSIEELEALTPGSPITHDGRTWVRDGIGFRCTDPETAILPLSAFEPGMAAGLVTLLPPPPQYEVGQTWGTSGYVHLICAIEDNRYTYASFFQDRYRHLAGTTDPNATYFGQRIDPRPDWLDDNLYEVTMALAAAQSRVDNQPADLSGEVARLNRQVASTTEARGRMVRAYSELQTELGDWGKEQDSIDSDLRDIFDDHDVEYRAKEEVTVTLNISGTTEIDVERMLGTSGIEEQIHPHRSLDWDGDSSDMEITVGWTHQIEAEIEVDSGDCACEEFDHNEYVRTWLRSNDVTFSDFNVDEVGCENC